MMEQCKLSLFVPHYSLREFKGNATPLQNRILLTSSRRPRKIVADQIDTERRFLSWTSKQNMSKDSLHRWSNGTTRLTGSRTRQKEPHPNQSMNIAVQLQSCSSSGMRPLLSCKEYRLQVMMNGKTSKRERNTSGTKSGLSCTTLS